MHGNVGRSRQRMGGNIRRKLAETPSIQDVVASSSRTAESVGIPPIAMVDKLLLSVQHFIRLREIAPELCHGRAVLRC